MTKKTDTNDNALPSSLKWVAIGISILLLVLAGFIVYKFFSVFGGFPDSYEGTPSTNWSTFGDYFGGMLNPIFGLLSFIALLATIVYQAKSLKLSANELELSRIELEGSREALTAQYKAIELQSFEQTFFSWLNTYRTLLDSIEKQSNYNGQAINGRRALIDFKYHALIDFNSNLSKGIYADNEQLILAIKESWDKLYKTNESQLDSLFRTLYRLLLWVDQNSKLNQSEKWLYISIIRSQLSWIEMVYLFYNCLTERGNKFKTLVEKYAIFDNLAFNDDISLTKLQLEYSAESFNSNLAREKLGL